MACADADVVSAVGSDPVAEKVPSVTTDGVAAVSEAPGDFSGQVGTLVRWSYSTCHSCTTTKWYTRRLR